MSPESQSGACVDCGSTQMVRAGAYQGRCFRCYVREASKRIALPDTDQGQWQPAERPTLSSTTWPNSDRPTPTIIQPPPMSIDALVAQEEQARRAMPSDDYDEAWDAITRELGLRQALYGSRPNGAIGKRRRVVIAGDLHVPFHHVGAFADMLVRESGADLCVVAGDLVDNHDTSRFPKERTDVTLRAEASIALSLVGSLASTFKHVVLMEGNHGKHRTEKNARAALTPQGVDALQIIAEIHAKRRGEDPALCNPFSVVSALAASYSNVTLGRSRPIPTMAEEVRVDWFWQLGSLLVMHAENYSAVPGRTGLVLAAHMNANTRQFGVSPWNLLCQAHTHGLSWLPYGSDQATVETGCLAHTMGYQTSGKRPAGPPQRVGWVTLETDENDIVDPNSVRPYWWEAEQWRRDDAARVNAKS